MYPNPYFPISDHIFVQYGKEVRRVLVSRLPIPLDTLLQKMVGVFSDHLTPDMVPLKAIYIQDPQTKIFYQLDDPADLTKGGFHWFRNQCISGKDS